MRITFCGTGGVSLNPERAGAAICVQHGEAGVLLDCGPGWLDRFLRAGLQPSQLHAVVLSHLHFDHAMGLGELLTRWAFEETPLPAIYGPADTAEYVESARLFARTQHRFLGGHRRLEALDRVEVVITRPGDDRELGGMRMEARAVPHVDYLECLARRFSFGGRSLVYSGDTKPAPEVMVPLAEGAAVLIHEAYTERAVALFGSAKPPEVAQRIAEAFQRVHSPVPAVAQIAKAAGARRLVLTHLLGEESAEHMRAEARAHFDGELIVATDGLVLEVADGD